MKKYFFAGFICLLGALLTSCFGFNIGDDEIRLILNSNGGSEISSFEIDGKSVIDMPSEPEWIGHNFDGWFYDNETFLQPFSEDSLINTPITKSFMVYAKWTI